jgi:hypothetical protein
MVWYKDPGVLPFEYPGKSIRRGLFAFNSAPGLKSLNFLAYGKAEVWIEGVKTDAVEGKKEPDGLTEYNLHVENYNPEVSRVVIKIEYKPGYFGAGAIPEYFRQTCGKGLISLGDWSEIDGLKSYSGGAWYRKSIILDSLDATNNVEIDLGDLVSSAELFVNGKSAGIKLSPPWRFDITEYARPGENQIEILIYNTLANNYISIPTRYRGSIKSGLIGPVKVCIVSHD